MSWSSFYPAEICGVRIKAGTGCETIAPIELDPVAIPIVRGSGTAEMTKPSRKALAPKVLEPCRRQLGVAHRVLYVSVPEIGLQRPGVVAGIGQRIATGMPKHVGMNPELEARLDAGPLHHLGEARRAERRAAFR